jgi:hypothetical protein
MAGEIDAPLREEVIECQRARSEFIRWKLILVAAVGSAAFGLGDKDNPKHPELLAFIPLICTYVDSVCLHNDSRIMMIGRFLRESPLASEAARAYEKFCAEHRASFYNEGFAVFISSLLLSVVIASIGFAGYNPEATPDPWHPNVLAASGLLGAALTLFLSWNYIRVQRGKEPIQVFRHPSKPKAKRER